MNGPIQIEGVKIDSEKINQFIQDNCYSKSAFARKCNISTKLLDKILSGNTNVRFTGLMRIADLMGVNLEDLLIL